MASQVLSGASNPSYTNNTGQNVRLLINYIASCTSMTWASVTVTGNSTVGKDIMTINGEFRSAEAPTSTGDVTLIDGATQGQGGAGSLIVSGPEEILSGLVAGNFVGSANIFYVPRTISPGGDFPSELVLADGEEFSATSGAFNIVVIKEDGT